MTKSIQNPGEVTEVIYTDVHREDIEHHIVDNVDPQAAAKVAPVEAVGLTYTTHTTHNTRAIPQGINFIDPLSLPGDGVVRTRNNTVTPFVDGVDSIIRTDRS